MFRPPVCISLTTIPSRLNLIVHDNLEDLLKQDYENLVRVYLTVPLENMRGQPATEKLPDWLQEEPFCSRVTVLRPQRDYGPIMKWIGAVHEIAESTWVFICDDDVRYRHNYISECVTQAAAVAENLRLKSIFNSHLFNNLTEATAIFGVDLIYGVHGAFVHSSFLRYVDDSFQRSLPSCCLRIDDDMVSVLARDGGYNKVRIPTGLDLADASYKFFFQNADSLTTSYNRAADRHNCHAIINPTYADNLFIAVVTLASVLGAILLVSMIFGVRVMLRRRREHAAKPKHSSKT